MSEEMIEEVLHRRARELAKPTRSLHIDDTDGHVVFRLGASQFALPLTAVLEVFTPRQVTPLPGWPRGKAGLTAWRGDLLLVMDIRELLGVAAAPNTLVDRTIVVRADSITAGIIVDGLTGIQNIDDTTQESMPDRFGTAAGGTITGITKTGVIVLDPAALLLHHAPGG